MSLCPPQIICSSHLGLGGCSVSSVVHGEQGCRVSGVLWVSPLAQGRSHAPGPSDLPVLGWLWGHICPSASHAFPPGVPAMGDGHVCAMFLETGLLHFSISVFLLHTQGVSLCPSRTLHGAQEWNTLGPVSIPPALGSISWRLCLFTSKMRSLCSTLPRKPKLCWDPGAAPDPGPEKANPGPEKANPQRMGRPTSSTHGGWGQLGTG